MNLSKGTPAEHAALHFRLIKAEVQCMACFQKYHPWMGKSIAPIAAVMAQKYYPAKSLFLNQSNWIMSRLKLLLHVNIASSFLSDVTALLHPLPPLTCSPRCRPPLPPGFPLPQSDDTQRYIRSVSTSAGSHSSFCPLTRTSLPGILSSPARSTKCRLWTRSAS